MTTFLFVLFLFLGVVLPALIFFLFRASNWKFWYVPAALVCLLCLLISFVQTAKYVKKGTRAVVFKKFGSPLTNGRVIAFEGERGPQVKTLAPGWNFWLWPWQYEVRDNPDFFAQPGNVGVIVAKDGNKLEGAYAPEQDLFELLDGKNSNAENGLLMAGPQLTVVPPGKGFPYNDALLEITQQPALINGPSHCAVIVSQVGKTPALVDGKPPRVVEDDEIGIRKTPYGRGTFYIHPHALKPVQVRTTKRVYVYSGENQLGNSQRPDQDHSIGVKSRDGFKFPVDVKVEVSIKQEDAPFVVADIGPPDEDLDEDGFDNLEEKIIIPAISEIFRNTAEIEDALNYLNNRSGVSKHATELFVRDMNNAHVTVHAVRIADIGLDETPEGKELLKTQTDQQIAKQQVLAYQEQKIAAESQELTVAAQAKAEAQTELVKSQIKIQSEENIGLATQRRAAGEAAAALAKIEAYGGIDNYMRLEMLKLGTSAWSSGGSNVPNVLVIGTEGSLDTTVLSTWLQNNTVKAEE